MTQIANMERLSTAHPFGACGRIALAKVIVWGCFLFSLPSYGAATCSVSSNSSSFSPTVPSRISSNRDAQQIGALVGAGSLTSPQYVVSYSGFNKACDVRYFDVAAVGSQIPNVTYSYEGREHPVYETGIPGIGYALMASVFGYYSNPSDPWRAVTSEAVKMGIDVDSGALNMRAAIVFTGSLATGSYSTPRRQIATVAVHGGDWNRSYYAYLQPLTINVAARTCTVTSGATTMVTMPQLVTYSLKSVGDVSPKSAPFSMGLKCDANINVYATLTDATNPTNTGNVLSLAKNSTASGVGIQILKQGANSPFNFGPESAAKGNTNQWSVGKSGTSGATLSVPFEARYIKTAETIKPGTVNALSTITFSYQ